MTSRRFWREPFVQFFILGILLFIVDAILRDSSDSVARGEIVVTTGRIENLSAVFEKTWQRPPTAEELQSLVDNYILDEALFRHGVALGVDQDDNVIRRRVRQKVDFLVDDLASPAEPQEAELDAWLDKQRGDYAIPAVFTFFQIYFDPQRHGSSLNSEVDRVLDELRDSSSYEVDFSKLGDATLLNPAYSDYRADRVAQSFGGSFAQQLEEAPIGEWAGPLESAFGVHIVYLEAKIPARIPELAEVRDAVERDWRRDKREARVQEFQEQTLAGYEVVIEWPESSKVSIKVDE